MSVEYSAFGRAPRAAPLVLIAGPCVIESEEHVRRMACGIRDAEGAFIFKASFDKANRTSGEAFRGPGLREGLRILAGIKAEGFSILTDIHEPAIYSSRWIEAGSFTRLANITIGYTFDLPTFVGAARGSRVYISGDNLGLWTPYSGYDPEVHSQLPGIAPRGIDYLHYPRPRTWTGGLRVAF